jgi:HK97 family phage portal protein
MTGFEFFETLTLHALFTHGGFAQIARNAKGEVIELFPLMPNMVTVVAGGLGEVFFDVSDGAGNKTRLPREAVLHIRGPSWDGYRGLDTVHQAREALGLAIATEETHAALHANGARPAGVLSVQGTLDPAARERLKAAWNAAQGGVRNAFKTAVLDMAATWTPMTQTGVDAQHIELRKHQIEEVCRAFRVFPQMVGHSDKTSTFASAESFFLAHVVHTLTPWVERWEQVCERDLLGQ